MIDEHLLGLSAYQGLLHLVDTTWGIEVETENQVGNLKQHIALFAMLIVTHNLISIGQPHQEVGILIGHNHGNILSAQAHILGPS